MEILVNVDDLLKVSKDVQNEAVALEKLVYSIRTNVSPLFSMESERIRALLESYEDANESLLKGVAILSCLSNELKNYASDLKKVNE